MRTTWKVGDGFEDLHDLGPAPAGKDDGLANVTLYKEDCKKCGGSGFWRQGYKCFACKGKGTMEFKTSSATRASSRKSSAKRAKKNVADMLDTWQRYLKSHVAVAEWLGCNVSEFAVSLSTAGAKYGSLTKGQEQAVYKSIATDEDGLETFRANTPKHILDWLDANRASEEFAASLYAAGIRYGSLTDNQMACVERSVKTAVTAADPDDQIDLSELPTGYYAVPDGDTRLKIAIRRPRKNSNWFGWIFVDDGAEYGARKNYGRQGPDALYTGQIRDELRAVLADPLVALKAYGILTGSCGVCGRKLEDEESVALGIGPICAGKLTL